MTFKDALGYLLDNGYLVLVENQVVVTRKLTDSLNLPKSVEVEQVAQQTQTAVMTAPAKTVVKPTKKGLKEIWDQFIVDAEIPWRVTNPRGEKYTVRQYGPTAATRLKEIIEEEGIDYQILVESTKYYYKNTTYKSTLFNYFIKELWREEYTEFGKKDHLKEGDWGNKFED